MKKGEVLRSCLGCKKVSAKKSLIRLVLSPHNEIVLDYYSKLPGRGAYVCPNVSCMEKAFGERRLSKAFKCSIKKPALDEVIKIFISKSLEKTASLLSMAIRSRKVLLGTEAVEGEFRKGKLSLLLLSGSLSETARSRWKGKAAAKGIHVANIPDTESIDKVLGGKKVAVLKDPSLAAAVMWEIDKLEKIAPGLIH